MYTSNLRKKNNNDQAQDRKTKSELKVWKGETAVKEMIENQIRGREKASEPNYLVYLSGSLGVYLQLRMC